MSEFSQSARETCQIVDDIGYGTQDESARKFLLGTICDAIMLQTEFDNWLLSLPPEWTREPESAGPSNKFNPASRLKLRSKLVSCFWAQIQSCLVYFYNGIIACCKRLLRLGLPESSSEIKLASSTILLATKNTERLLSDICKSIPISFEEGDRRGCEHSNPPYTTAYGYLLTWPLVLVTRSRLATANQRLACEAALSQFSSLMGLRVASIAVEQKMEF